MLHIPSASSEIREMFSIEDLAYKRFVTLREAISAARRSFASDSAVRSVNCLVLTAVGEVKLIAFGPRGGRKTLWDFGTL
jgi:hypothetical protein